MSLDKLSTEDLLALREGDLGKVSDEGLMLLRGDTPPEPAREQKASGAAIKPDYSATADEQTFLQNLLAGSGGAFKGMALGARQLIPGLDKPTPEEVKEWKDAMSGLRGTAGGNIGEIGTHVLTSAIPIGGATATAAKLGGASAVAKAAVPIATGVGVAEGAFTPAETPEERATNIAVSGAAGAAGQKVANALSQRLGTGLMRTQLTPEAQANVAALERLGYEITPGQRTGSHIGRNVESVMANAPIMSGPFDKIAAKNQTVGNKVVAAAIGEPKETEIGSRVIGNAYDRIGNVFDSVRDDTVVKLGIPSVRNRLATIWGEYADLVEPTPLVKKVGDLIGPTGYATREQLGSLSSKLRTAAKSQLTSAQGSRELGMLYNELRELVEDQIERTLPLKQQKIYRTAREQYRTLSGLDISKTLNPATGDVDLSKLPSAMERIDKAGFARGKRNSDLIDLARGVAATGGDAADTGTKLSMLSRIGNVASAAPVVAAGLGLGPAAAGATLGAEWALPRAYLGLGNWASRGHPEAAKRLAGFARYTSPVGGLTAMRTVPEEETY